MVISSSTLLVNVAEDAEVRLVSLLGGSPEFAEQCQACIDSGNAAELVKTILQRGDSVTALLTLENEDEAVSALALLAALLDRTDGAVLAQQLADAIVQASVPDVTERKLALLSVLYNMRSGASEKCRLLGQLLQLASGQAQFLAPESLLGRLLSCGSGDDDEDAADAKTNAVVQESVSKGGGASSSVLQSSSPSRPRLVALLDAWGDDVTLAERQDLYRIAAHSLPVGDVRRQRFLLLWVESFSAKGLPASAAAAQEAAREAAVGAIRDPITLFAQQRNLLQHGAIQALPADLLGLLKVFQEGKLSDYKDFCAANGGEAALMDKWGLDAASCQRNMRILSLCSLASEQEEIPYATIAETLQLDKDENVESWVIAAVSSGLVQAKMDQLSQTVLVERSVVRKFDMEQWKVLQSRLSVWKQNVGSILETLKQSQAAAGATPAV